MLAGALVTARALRRRWSWPLPRSGSWQAGRAGNGRPPSSAAVVAALVTASGSRLVGAEVADQYVDRHQRAVIVRRLGQVVDDLLEPLADGGGPRDRYPGTGQRATYPGRSPLTPDS